MKLITVLAETGNESSSSTESLKKLFTNPFFLYCIGCFGIVDYLHIPN